MDVRFRRLVTALGLTLAVACKGDSPVAPMLPIDVPLPSSLKVGDLVRVNVNSTDACSNGIYRIARVEAIGSKSMILADTLNPKGGFTTTDYQRYAAKFDTLVYPVDEGAFGAATDIDNNGRIGIIFTRSVNELTPAGSNSYVGGFTFSRDLFPKVANARADACATSNQGEYFYALAPDPLGEVNGNKRTAGFVDSATVPVLGHELEHLINASRKIYINTGATEFEQKWLDEGLAHIAEELLFYRESGTAPRQNLDVTAIRSSRTIIDAFNANMLGNAGRYRSYLSKPDVTSPYAGNDSLSTRGGAWNWLRYMADQKVAGVARTAGAAIELNGPGSVSAPGGTTGAEYYATLVNSLPKQDSTSAYGITASAVIPPTPSRLPLGGPTLSLMAAPMGSSAPVLLRDDRFEARLRAAERTLGPAQIAAAREWRNERRTLMEVPQGGRYSVSAAVIPSPDSDIWFRLVNNTLVGLANVQQVLGVDPAVAVSDWSASHAVDDQSALVANQFLQLSWNWHSVYSALCQTQPCAYPLSVTTMIAGTTYTGSVLSGGAKHFKFAVPAGGNATITVTSTSPAAASLKLLIVRTK